VILLVTIIMGALASRLQVDPNILKLLPENDPTTRAIQKLNDEEGGTNLLTISINGEDEDKLHEFMLGLKTELEALENIDYVLYELDKDLLTRIGLMRQDPAELRDLSTRFQQLVALGPNWRLLGGNLKPIQDASEAMDQAEASHTPFLQDGVARLLVRPTGSAYDPEYARPLMADVHEIIDSEMKEYEEERLAAGFDGSDLEVAWIGGAYKHAVEDLENVIHDLQFTAGVSLGLVLLLLSIAFRDARAVLLLFTPLLVGNIWTLGYASIAVGTLNTFTSFAAAILIGLGVDFSIHLYSRYREERIESDTVSDAVIRAWDRAGPPCFTAAITSAGGFCALWAAGFQGFQQLGTLLAGGVIFCLFAVVLTLPLLILWRERGVKPVPLRVLPDTGERSGSRYRFSPIGIVAVVMVTVVAAIQLPDIGFEYDISELRARGLAFADLDEEQRSLAQDSYAPIVVSYPDDESLRSDYSRFHEEVSAGELAYVGRVLSAYSLVPLEQTEQSQILRDLVQAVQPEKTIWLESDPTLPPELRTSLERIRGFNPEPVEISDLPRGFRSWLSPGEGSSHRMMLIPKGNMWDIQNNVALKTEIEGELGNGEAAGEYLAMAVLFKLVEGDAPRVALLALSAVLVFCFIDLRRPSLAIGALAALVTGMCWAGAGMAGLDIKLSLVNFVGIPILMGIGVDVIIHLVHRIKEEGRGRVRWALATTGWACGLSAATTILSFASLLLANAQGVRSLGNMIVLGLTLVTLAAFITVPTGWTAIWRVQALKKKAD
jgi:predicted RND superfamily exporter protein